MVRHGHGLQLYSGQRNEDGVMTKYEGAWLRNKKHGQGLAVFTDGSQYSGKFCRDVIDGQGTYSWTQGHEYKGAFRDGQMDGQGEFTHANGHSLSGLFKRNLYQKVSRKQFLLFQQSLFIDDFFMRVCRKNSL